ncbi:MAG TPA: NAD(P)-dependent oxidoreductase [Bauldia sp.]|nr:NAD(P)-dependent oxidoreductase [Bauldia sp.]
MPEVKIGLTADLFDSSGQPIFGTGALTLFAEHGLAYTILPPDGGVMDPEAIAAYDALLVGAAAISEATLARDSGRLRVVARNGVGYDALDADALARRGILVVNAPLAVRYSVATTALAFLLALSLKLPARMRMIREGRFRERGNFLGIGLPGRTLGIVGLGGIGREIVRQVAPLGMRIVAADPYLTPADAAGSGVELVPLETLLRDADFVVLACLLNASTRHLINAARLAQMKPTAFLINVARGAVVDEAALIAALQSGQIAGAGLDVFETEPVAADNPLLAMENVIPTPHSLCWTDTFMDGVARSAIEDLIAVVEGRLPKHVVNRAALDHPRVAGWLAKG